MKYVKPFKNIQFLSGIIEIEFFIYTVKVVVFKRAKLKQNIYLKSIKSTFTLQYHKVCSL